MKLKHVDARQVAKVINFLKDEELNRGRDPLKVYTKGNCGNLFTHLKSVFNTGMPIQAGNHIITTFDKRFAYDIEKTMALPLHLAKHFRYEELSEDEVEKFSNNYSWLSCVEKGDSFFSKREFYQNKEKEIMTATNLRLQEYCRSNF